MCSLLLITSAALIGACSGGDDDDGGSSGAACHCEWGDTCDEMPSTECVYTQCESNGEDVKASGACADTDVIGTCDCSYEEMIIYYRSSFIGDPVEDCEFWCDGVYTAR